MAKRKNEKVEAKEETVVIENTPEEIAAAAVLAEEEAAKAKEIEDAKIAEDAAKLEAEKLAEEEAAKAKEIEDIAAAEESAKKLAEEEEAAKLKQEQFDAAKVIEDANKEKEEVVIKAEVKTINTGSSTGDTLFPQVKSVPADRTQGNHGAIPGGFTV
jgi:hypothetical protein